MPDDEHPPRRRRFLRWCIRIVVLVVVPPVLYVAAALGLGAIPTGSDYAPAPDGVRIQVVTNGVHLGLVLPMRAAGEDWSAFLDGPRAKEWCPVVDWVEVGWGDRDFYLKVPEWDDLTLGIAAKAVLWPSATAMRVIYRTTPASDWGEPRDLVIAPDAYRKLVAFVRTGFRADDGRLAPIVGFGYESMRGRDEFYEGRGNYHLFYTCNTWVIDALAAADLPAPLWTPFDFPAYWHLPAPTTTTVER